MMDDHCEDYRAPGFRCPLARPACATKDAAWETAAARWSRARDEAERADEEAETKKAAAEDAATKARDDPGQAAVEQWERAKEEAEAAAKDAADKHLLWQETVPELSVLNFEAQREQDLHRDRVTAKWATRQKTTESEIIGSINRYPVA